MGWDVTIASPAEGWLPDAVSGTAVQHAGWEATRSPGLATLREAGSLRSIVARGFDVVHLHSSKAGFAGRLWGRPKASRSIFQPHAWSFHAVPARLRGTVRAWERRAARRTDVVVCVSEAEMKELGRTLPNAVVIPNGVDLTRWRVASGEERVEAAAALGLGRGPIVVCVGRLAVQKGQDLLLDAWPRVTEKVPATLVFVGDGPERAALEARASGSVRFVGDQDDARPWLVAADVVVLPSRWEGMSLVLLEAMATGRSIVATDVAGTHEALSDAGGIVPVEAVGALATSLIERLGDPALRTREELAARARVEARHDLRATLASVNALYSDGA